MQKVAMDSISLKNQQLGLKLDHKLSLELPRLAGKKALSHNLHWELGGRLVPNTN